MTDTPLTIKYANCCHSLEELRDYLWFPAFGELTMDRYSGIVQRYHDMILTLVHTLQIMNFNIDHSTKTPTEEELRHSQMMYNQILSVRELCECAYQVVNNNVYDSATDPDRLYSAFSMLN